jgi:hypothetical protein
VIKRFLSHLGIGAYLVALAIGIFAHAFSLGNSWHPAMYYIVWDMFCGWSFYEGRVEIIGEGESGKFYELAPGPWGDFHPYGRIGRQHYDCYADNAARFAINCLKHTDHEPMTQIFVIEEEFPKKFNLPDKQYEAYYGKPKEFHKYCHRRFVLDPAGQILKTQPIWLTYQYQMGLRDNPRLIADFRRARPFLAFSPDEHAMGAYATGSFADTPLPVSVRSSLAE